jgi:predicted porin
MKGWLIEYSPARSQNRHKLMTLKEVWGFVATMQRFMVGLPSNLPPVMVLVDVFWLNSSNFQFRRLVRGVTPNLFFSTLEKFSMKKTLIALAAVAVSSAAMAQVTIGGTININAIQNGKVVDQTGTAAATHSKTQATGAANTWTTSQVVISGAEDLGNGLKASFTINAAMDGFAARDQNIALSGGFGTVRLGRFVPASAMAYHGYTGAASASAIGTTYGIGAAASAAATTGNFAPTIVTAASTDAAISGGSFERNSNLVQYTSPSFSGVTLNASYGTNSTDASATLSEADTEQQGLSITYAAGPLSIGAGMNERNHSFEGTASAVGAKVNAELDWIGASYNFGVATVSADRKSVV